MGTASRNLGFTFNNTSFNPFSCWGKLHPGVEHEADLALRLNSPDLYGSIMEGTKRTGARNESEDPECSLMALDLGFSPGSSENNSKVSSTISLAKETDEESSLNLGLNFQPDLAIENSSIERNSAFATHNPLETVPKIDLNLSLATRLSESVVTNITPVARTDSVRGSESSGWVFGSYLGPSLSTSKMASSFLSHKITAETDPTTIWQDLSSTMIKSMKDQVACTSGATNCQQRNPNTKNCKFPGCGKGARGASGFCIAHGGGRRCQKLGCQKGAEGRTIYCKAHGGGRRCQFLGCTKSAEGHTEHCIAHGGGRRCTNEGCTRAARGKSGLCIRHGGGKRCKIENCTKSAEGYSGLCISHGGGKRCHFPECTKGAQGSTKFCKAHGGGKRCTFLGCTKGAEGSTAYCKGHGGGKRCSFEGGVCPKSVHGGTQYCVAHGGGKRCAIAGCTKSARGRTDYCVRHGGGKRCKSEGCGKSAQGSTDFCKAHGGGKRCSWGQAGSDFSGGGPACDRFARGKTGLCAAHSALVQDRCVHGGGTLGTLSALCQTPDPKKIKLGLDGEDTGVETRNDMKDFLGRSALESKSFVLPPNTVKPSPVSLPEGRVHGGILMALLSANSSLGNSSTAETTMHSWM